MNRLIILLFLAIMISTTGCVATYMSYKSSEREIVGERVIASGDETAIKAWKNGETVGLGVDVLATEVLTKHPIRQVACAVADAAILYGAKEGLEYLVESTSSRDINVNVSNSDNINVTVSSDNDTSTDNDTVTTTTTSTKDASSDSSQTYATP